VYFIYNEVYNYIGVVCEQPKVQGLKHHYTNASASAHSTYSFYPRKRRCSPVIQIEIEQPVAHSELQKQIAVSVCGIFTER
jgi:hypothetical protein